MIRSGTSPRVAGCTCPVIDNSYGAGHYGNGEKYGWWYDAGCPLHNAAALSQAPNDGERVDE